jgi:hypothetical protein
MNKETIVFEGTKMEFSYDQELLGKEMTAIKSAGDVVASIEFEGHVFTLESNGERNDYWLETVMYEPHDKHGTTESSFSDPFHEIPKSKEEAWDFIWNWYQEEIKHVVAK